MARASVDAIVQGVPVGIEAEPQNAKSGKRITALLPHLGHLSPGGEADLDGTNQFGSVMGVNSGGRFRVQAPQDGVKVGRTFLPAALAQSRAQLFGALRSSKQAIEQRAQVEPSTTHDNGQASAILDFSEDLPRLAGIVAGSHVVGGGSYIQQVMRYARAFWSAGFGCADFKLAHQRNGIAINDLACEAFSESERECSLSAGRGSKDADEQRIRSNAQRKLHWMAYQYRTRVMVSRMAAMISRPVVSIA